MDVTFWFDPACPFCWMTSRWVRSVADDRDLHIDWQPISLLLKNDPPADDPRRAELERTHGMLRVVEAVREAGRGDRIGDLYTELGRHIHHANDHDVDVALVLEGLGLDPALAAAADDERFDRSIRAAMDEGLALTGDDVGTPLIAFDPGSGLVGLFGPVVTEFPHGEDGLRLWDSFVTMAATPGFFEAKRERQGTPDTSTIPTEELGVPALSDPAV